jgi:hypothetical protein
MSLERLDSMIEAMAPAPERRYDAALAPSMFVQNELQQVMARTYDQKYPALDALNHAPLATGIAQGAMSWAFDSGEIAGQAEWIGPNPTRVPGVEIGKRRHTFPIAAMGVGFNYTVQELASAMYMGVPLSQRKADAARRQAKQFEHNIVLLGDAALGIAGLYNNTAVPLVNVPNGDWLGAATGDEIAEDVSFLADRPWLTTNQVEQVDTMLFPPSLLRKMQTTRMGSVDSTTVMQFVQNVNPHITTWGWQRDLETAGTSGGKRILAYRKSPDEVVTVIPMYFTFLDPQPEGFAVSVPGWQTLGGTVFFYPRSAVYGEGM